MTDIAPPFHQAATDLDEDEAMKGSMLLENLMQAARETNAAQAATTPTTTPTGRRRGRATGSRNASTTTRVNPPPSGTRGQGNPNVPPKPLDPNALTPQEKRELIEARASELQEKIADGINETIMLALTSFGLPSELLYKPGQAPQQIQESQKYTDLAKELIVSPNQARYWGRFLAELENTEQGKKVSAATGGGNGPLLIFGALSLLTGVQYIQNASNAFKNLKPYMDQYKAMQAIAEANARQMREQAEAEANASPSPGQQFNGNGNGA